MKRRPAPFKSFKKKNLRSRGNDTCWNIARGLPSSPARPVHVAAGVASQLHCGWALARCNRKCASAACTADTMKMCTKTGAVLEKTYSTSAACAPRHRWSWMDTSHSQRWTHVLPDLCRCGIHCQCWMDKIHGDAARSTDSTAMTARSCNASCECASKAPTLPETL